MDAPITLSDSDLLGSLLGGKRAHAKQAETGDEDGKQSEFDSFSPPPDTVFHTTHRGKSSRAND